MNKEADQEKKARGLAASLLPSCFICMISLAGFWFTLARGTPLPPAAVPAGELLLRDDKGQLVDLNASSRSALYYHEDDSSAPFTGLIEASYPNNDIRMQAKVVVGRLDGPSVTWYQNSGRIHKKIEYRSGRIFSFKEFYEENGTIKSQWPALPPKPRPTDKDLADFELRGTLVFERSNKGPLPFSGTAIELYGNGAMKKRESFKEGGHHGIIEWWHQNGKPWYSANFKLFPVGDWEEPFPDGKVERWRSDFTREVVSDWENGFLKSVITYAPDGTESGKMEDGTGTLIYYHPNGNKKKVEVYEDDPLIPSKEIWYDEDGVKIDPSPARK